MRHASPLHYPLASASREKQGASADAGQEPVNFKCTLRLPRDRYSPHSSNVYVLLQPGVTTLVVLPVVAMSGSIKTRMSVVPWSAQTMELPEHVIFCWSMS
jgi:hypothetical protein